MNATTNRNDTCIFCTRGEAQAVHRHELALVLPDTYPLTKGHSLVVPRRHVASFFDLTMDERMAILELLEAISKRRYISPLYPAIVNAGLKDNNKAIEYLNKAYEARHPGLVLIRIEPMFDGIRADPRFNELIKRFEPIP